MKLTKFRTTENVGVPVYADKPFVVLSKEDVVLFAGTKPQVRNLSAYFNECEVRVRRHDLHLNNNTRL